MTTSLGTDSNRVITIDLDGESTRSRRVVEACQASLDLRSRS